MSNVYASALIGSPSSQILIALRKHEKTIPFLFK
jgi:hypothetical protein